jgi:hypothetical protein
MNQSQQDYESRIETLRVEKQALFQQITGLNERNMNQVMLLKRLESARQAERKEFEAQISELKEALLQERIKSRNYKHFENGTLSPSASSRTLVASPPREKRHDQNGESNDRSVSIEDRKNWKEAGLSPQPPNAVIEQSAFLDVAMKKKGQSQRRLWGNLFGSATKESENEKELSRNKSIVERTTESQSSKLTKDIMQALDENKHIVEEREEELRAREEVQRVKEDALQNYKRLSQMEKQGSRWKLLSIFREEDTTHTDKTIPTHDENLDSTDLDVDTLRRLIADRTAGMDDDNEEGKKEDQVYIDERHENDSDSDEFGDEDEDDEDDVYTEEEPQAIKAEKDLIQKENNKEPSDKAEDNEEEV